MHEKFVNKILDISIEHAVRVGCFIFGAVILYHPVGMKHIGPYLVPPSDIQLGIFHRLELLPFFFQLQLVQARAQNRPGHFPVPDLRTLVLAGNHDSRRDVRNPHRRVRDIDVLSAGAGRPVGVDAEILLVDLDFDLVVQLRIDKTEAKLVCRLSIAPKGEMRTRRWMPLSEET